MVAKQRPYYVIGVDPGNTGTIVILDTDGGYISHHQMPTKTVGKDTRVCGKGIADLLHLMDKYVEAAYIEQVHAMPKQGVSSTFTFGYAAGAVQGALEALKIPCYKIRPQEWKKMFDLKGSEKDDARLTLVDELSDKVEDINAKGKGQALADAILVARCGIQLKKQKEAENNDNKS